MNAVLEEKLYIEDVSQEDEFMSHDEIAEITRDLIIQHREAYTALANA